MKKNDFNKSTEDGQKPDVKEAPSHDKPSAPSQFDIESLRIGQDFSELAGVEKVITTIPVHKPFRQDFVRVHEDETYRMQTAILTWQEDREVYLLARNLWDEFPGEIVPVELFTAVNRQGVVFLWPVRLPGHDGKWNQWHRSGLDGAQKAMTRWVRLAANMSLGAYEVFAATADLPDPEWPSLSFKEILQIAFRENFIESLEHPICKRLRGAL